MELLQPEIKLPDLELQYIIKDQQKYFRIVSGILDPLLIELIKTGKIRVQIWLERELRKRSGSKVKRSWVHSIDNTRDAPQKLFTSSEYNYGEGLGWGWQVHGLLPDYSTTNGYAPTEFEITLSQINGNQIKYMVNVMSIFSNIIKLSRSHTYATTGNNVCDLEILGRHRMSSQPIRAKLVVNYHGKVLMSSPSNPMILGIHKNQSQPTFNASQIKSHLKVSYYK